MNESESESEVSQLCPTLWNPMDYSLPGSSIHPWDFPGKSTGVGCLNWATGEVQVLTVIV